MIDFQYVRGSLTGSALAVEATDPNTSLPSDKDCAIADCTGYGPLVVTLTADAACVVEGWIYSTLLDKWVKLFSQAITAYAGFPIANVPDQARLYMRVQANAGNAKVVAALFG